MSVFVHFVFEDTYLPVLYDPIPRQPRPGTRYVHIEIASYYTELGQYCQDFDILGDLLHLRRLVVLGLPCLRL
jgi:hypothetical protein